MLLHHGTRGAALPDMAPIDRNEPWNVTNRRGEPVCIPGIEDWRCQVCTDKKPDDAQQYWVRKHLDQCRQCGTKRPNKLFRFHQSKCHLATAAAKLEAGSDRLKGASPKAKAAAKTTPPKAGPDGQKADTQETRELRRKLAATEKKLADSEKREKKHAGAATKEPAAAGDDDEFQDAEEGGNDGVAGCPKVWQATMDINIEENKDLKKKIAKSPCQSKTDQWEKQIEDNIAANTVLQDRIWSSQCPQVQLQKKSEKCAKLKKKQPEILEQIKEASHNQQTMQAEADRYEAQAAELLAQHRTNAAEIERLNAESNLVLKENLGQDTGLAQLMAKEMAGKLKSFDDPLFALDESVARKKVEVETMLSQWVELMASVDYLRSNATEIRERNVSAAKQRADEAAKEAKAAEELAKQAEKDAKPQQEEAQPPAAAAAGPTSQKLQAAAAVQPVTAAADTHHAPSSERLQDKSRSPPPRSRGGGSASSTATPAEQAVDPKVAAALAKPARERNDDEVLLAASVAKSAKTDSSSKSWADVAVADGMEEDGEL